MRFCNNCGYQMGPQAAAAAPVSAPMAPLSPPRAPAAAPAARSAYGASNAQPGSAPVCWRCHSIGDSGADFCKFCGARYADAPAAAGAAGASVGGAVSAYAHQPAPYQPAPYQPAPAQVVAPQGQPLAPQAQPGPRAESRPAIAMLVAILKDGTDGRAYPIHDEITDIGQKEGAIQLADDPYLSSRHARIVTRTDGLLVRDLDSVNGIYVRIREPAEILDGDFLLLGQQVLRFELLPEMELPLGPATQRGALVFGTPEVPRLARLVQYTTEGVARDIHYLYRDETVVGREQGDIVCTDDPFMSRRHAAITIDRAAKRFTLRDLGSSNGTAVRIRGERSLRPGDQFRVGRHLFRYDRADGARSGA